MAKDPSKTELPTQKRLKDERKKGNVPISKEISSLVMMLVYFIIFKKHINRFLIFYNKQFKSLH